MMQPDPPASLAVVVLNWSRRDDPLDGARAALAWRNLNPRVILVANECDSARADRLRAAVPGAEVLADARNLGFAGGNNAALRRLLQLAHPPAAALLLNSDAALSEAAADAMLGALRNQPSLAAVGVALREGGRVSYGGADIARGWRTRITTEHPGDLPPVLDVDYVPGTAAMLRLDAAASVGLLDEDYFFSGEMADWCDRARAAGWRCAVLTRLVADHAAAGPAAVRDALYVYYSLRNRFLFVKKRGRPRALGWAWALRGARMAAGALVRGRMVQARAAAAGVRDGLRGAGGPAPTWLQP